MKTKNASWALITMEPEVYNIFSYYFTYVHFYATVLRNPPQRVKKVPWINIDYNSCLGWITPRAYLLRGCLITGIQFRLLVAGYICQSHVNCLSSSDLEITFLSSRKNVRRTETQYFTDSFSYLFILFFILSTKYLFLSAK